VRWRRIVVTSTRVKPAKVQHLLFGQVSNCSNKALVMLFLRIALRVRITRSSDVPSARPGYPRPVRCEPRQQLHAAFLRDRTGLIRSTPCILRQSRNSQRMIAAGVAWLRSWLVKDEQRQLARFVSSARNIHASSFASPKRIMFTTLFSPWLSRLYNKKQHNVCLRCPICKLFWFRNRMLSATPP
jgi:hypothetical protein